MEIVDSSAALLERELVVELNSIRRARNVRASVRRNLVDDRVEEFVRLGDRRRKTRLGGRDSVADQWR
jgi:hypothetical protein